MTRLLAALALLLAACSSGPTLRGDHDRGVARETAYTHTYEVLFGDGAQPVGYLVEFYRVPQGIVDERPFKPGTVLLQDLDFRMVGFITPGAHGYVFDAAGATLDLGYGGRDRHVAEVFGRSGAPSYRTLQPGVPPPSRR